ncbi:MAG: SelT/SelW/SelH family protein [Acetobacteraceae bacterium]|nr:SelT/SelW/SelH family protein [Acetobacteraceae bacterium]
MLKAQSTAAVTLKKSGGGVFEIVVDGRLAWSKKATGAFPTDEQVIATVG